MKKLISTTLVLTMILSMCACGAKKENASSETASSEAVTEAVSGETASSDMESSKVASDEGGDSTAAISEAETDTAAEQIEETPSEDKVYRIGVLTMLNLTENEMLQYRDAEAIAGKVLTDEGYFQMDRKPEKMDMQPGKKDKQRDREIIFYDTLDAMLMALNAGDIDELSVYYKTGQYLCATNDNLELLYNIDYDKERNAFATVMLTGHMSNDFAFLMMEGNESLRDEFSNAINDMKDDGTMDTLISEQMDDLINGGDIKAVEMPKIEGAETVKVAVTGALPPMDYVAADGTPAGFNTAVLAEISQRIGKNIELVVVDSIGRATALSSGTVDAVFWTRTNELSRKKSVSSEEEMEANIKEKISKMSDDELKTYNEIRELINFDNYGKADMPEGTISTVPYYSDILVPVKKKQ